MMPKPQNKSRSRSSAGEQKDRKSKELGQPSLDNQVVQSVSALHQYLNDEGVPIVSKKELKVDVSNGIESPLEKVIIYDIPTSPSLLLTLRSMFSSNAVYPFRMTRVATLSTSGSGSLDLQTPIYPSNFLQYSALAMLFSMCRLRSTTITLTNVAALAPVGASNYSYLPITGALVFDPSGVGSSSGNTYASLCRRNDVRLFTSNKRENVRHHYRARTTRPWSTVSSTGTSTFDPQGGVVGVWAYSYAFPGTPSVTYHTYTIDVVYELTTLL